jgi:hypothetical protein
LHDIDIPRWAVDRVLKRRGAEHVFTDLDPARTALIVILQNAFMLPGVAFVEIKTAPQRDIDTLNYRAIMLTDANAADTDADHNAALTAFYSTFGDIMPTDMAIELLTRQ